MPRRLAKYMRFIFLPELKIEAHGIHPHGWLCVELALSEVGPTAALVDFRIQPGVVRPRREIAARQRYRRSLERAEPGAERLGDVETKRQLAPFHERRVLDITERRGREELRANECRLLLERGVRIRQRAALTVERVVRLLPAPEVLRVVQLLVAAAPLEQGGQRHAAEQRHVQIERLRVGWQLRTHVRRVQRIEAAVDLVGNDQALRRIHRDFGAREQTIPVRIVVLDGQGEERARREPFAVSLRSAIELNGRDVLTQDFDPVAECRRGDACVDANLLHIEQVRLKPRLRAPVLDLAEILEDRAGQPRRGREVARNERILRDPLERGEISGDAIVEEADVQTALDLRRALDLQARIPRSRQDEGGELDATTRNGDGRKERLRVSESRALARLPPAGAKPELAQEIERREERFAGNYPRGVHRRVVGKSLLFVLRQPAVVVAANAGRQEEPVGERNLLTREYSDGLLVGLLLIHCELARRRGAGPRARGDALAVALVGLKQPSLIARAERRVADEVRCQRERAGGGAVGGPEIVRRPRGLSEAQDVGLGQRQLVWTDRLTVEPPEVIESAVAVQPQPGERRDVEVRADDESVERLVRRHLSLIVRVVPEVRSDATAGRPDRVGLHARQVLGGTQEGVDERTENAVVVRDSLRASLNVRRVDGPIHLASHPGIDVRTHGGALDVVRAQNAVLLLSIARDEVRQCVATARDVQPDFRPRARLVGRRARVPELVERQENILGAACLVVDGLPHGNSRPIVRADLIGTRGVPEDAADVEHAPVLDVVKGRAWGEGGERRVVQRVIVLVLHLRAFRIHAPHRRSGASPFRADQNDAIRGGAAVESGCRRSLQDFDVLDLVGIDVIQARIVLAAQVVSALAVRGLNAVDVDQRLIGQRKAVRAPDTNAL